jgi:hypothetical protein
MTGTEPVLEPVRWRWTKMPAAPARGENAKYLGASPGLRVVDTGTLEVRTEKAVTATRITPELRGKPPTYTHRVALGGYVRGAATRRL